MGGILSWRLEKCGLNKKIKGLGLDWEVCGVDESGVLCANKWMG